MQGKVSFQRDWVAAALRLAALFGIIGGISFLQPSAAIGGACLLLLVFPAGLLLLPFMRSVHGAGTVLIAISILGNWMLYTFVLRWLMSRRRRALAERRDG